MTDQNVNLLKSDESLHAEIAFWPSRPVSDKFCICCSLYSVGYSGFETTPQKATVVA